MLGPGGVEEQGVGDRIDGLATVRHEELVQLVAEPRTAGLARQQDIEAALAERTREAVRLERLAGAVGPLDRDEPALRPVGTGHRPSVADGPARTDGGSRGSASLLPARAGRNAAPAR